MRIAFTHNLRLSEDESEAEFDRPETVRAITTALREKGHEVEPVEVSGPASRVVARLEALSPDLVLNTAEGTHGRFREGFFPALFDRLGLPFTGSDAYVCALTLDKQLTKMILAPHGVPIPGGVVVQSLDQLDSLSLRFPLIVKPNYEGSSMGILADSVVDDADELRTRVADRLTRFPSGVLVEEYIVGPDVVVPFIEGASPATGGVLEPAIYRYDPAYTGGRKYTIFDFELKNMGFDAVHVDVPAGLPAEQRARLMAVSRTILTRLGIRDVARIDYRLGPDGEPYFLEINALPSLEPGASVYRCGALAGLSTPGDVLQAVVRSAAERHGLPWEVRATRRRTRVRIGLAHDVQPVEARGAGTDVHDAIRSVREPLESMGHEVVELEATPELAVLLSSSGVDLLFLVPADPDGGVAMAQVPGLAGLVGIPHTGPDAGTLGLALDPGVAMRLVAQAAIPTPPFVLLRTGREKLPTGFRFPAVLEPTSGSHGRPAVGWAPDEEALRNAARHPEARPLLAWSQIGNRRLVTALLGERRPRVLKPLEVRPKEDGPIPGPRYRPPSGDGFEHRTPDLTPRTLREVERVARGAFTALGMRDVACIDVAIDGSGRVAFAGCDPLPPLLPGRSDLSRVARAAGLDERGLVAEILAPALRRLRERRRERILDVRR